MAACGALSARCYLTLRGRIADKTVKIGSFG
jgi:hypothetical protein